MNDTRIMVMSFLNQYHETQRRIELLRYELEHPSFVTSEEMIEILNYSHGEQGGTPGGHLSNKTPYIALNYQEEAQKMNAGNLDEIAFQLAQLEQQQAKLLHYISLMDKSDADLIRMTYLDNLDNEQIAAKLKVSIRTVSARRTKAIDRLCEMFEYTRGVQQTTPSI